MPSDPLSQLQQCLDQLNTQIYASLRYINTHHPAVALPSNIPAPSAAPLSNGEVASPPQLDPSDTLAPDHRPADAVTFAAAQRELAHDLIIKSKQIETSIRAIPSERTTAEQERRIKELESEMQEVLKERGRAEEERREWLERVDELIVGVRR